MGKEKHNAADAEARSDFLESRKQADLAEMKKEKRKSILVGIGVVLAIVLMVGVISFKFLTDSGFFLRRDVVVESTNYKVDSAMMMYFMNDQYQRMYDQFPSAFDSSKTLREMSVGTDMSMYTFVAEYARDYVIEMLAYCEAGKTAGLALDDEDRKGIDESIESLKANANVYGSMYYGRQLSVGEYLMITMQEDDLVLGSRVKEKDIRRALELTLLASKYIAHIQNNSEFTKEECEAYFAEHSDDYITVDLMMFTVESADFVKKDEEGNVTVDQEAARAAAEEQARTIAGAPDADTFKGLVKDFIVEVQGEEEEHAAEHVDELLKEDVLKTSTAHKKEALDWAFSAKAGETNIFTEDAASGDNVYFNIYYLVSEAGRDETLTRKVRHILVSFDDEYEVEEEGKTAEAIDTEIKALAKADAEKVYAEWKAAGFTEEKFLELNTKNNDDPGSVDKGGLYGKVMEGEMVEAFNDWVFAEERAVGDHDLIETTYGWHIMYYAGESDVAYWQKNVEGVLVKELLDEKLVEYKAGVKVNDAVFAEFSK